MPGGDSSAAGGNGEHLCYLQTILPLLAPQSITAQIGHEKWQSDLITVLGVSPDDSHQSGSESVLLETHAEGDAALRQVAALQQQLRRQQEDANAAMQEELEAMQQERLNLWYYIASSMVTLQNNAPEAWIPSIASIPIQTGVSSTFSVPELA